MEATIYDLTLELQRACANWSVTVKKGDTGRRLRLRLLSGGKAYPITDDCYAVFTAQKPDGKVIFNHCTRQGDRFLYDLTPQTTAAAGVLPCELRLYGKDDALLTSAAFTLTVEDTVYTEGDAAITSAGEATALTRLITQARDTIGEMEKVLENEVNHAVIDDSKAGTDAWSAKNIVDKLCSSFTESGPVVACEPVEGYPLGVVTQIQPVQSGSGDPSLDNIRPIAGHTAVKLTCCGKNLIPFPFRQTNGSYGGITWTVNGDATITLNGTASSNGTHFVLLEKAKTGIGIPVDGTYTMSCPGGSNSTYYLQPYVNGVFQTPVYSVPKTYNWTGTVDKLILWVAPNAVLENVVVKPQIEVGTVATDFESHQCNTFALDLGQTVYGGSLNWNTGVLTVTHGNIESYAGEAVPEDWVSSTGELSEGAQVVYALPIPGIVRLTPTEILALSGTNCLYSDTGDTTVTGKADSGKIIEKLTNAIIALGGNV